MKQSSTEVQPFHIQAINFVQQQPALSLLVTLAIALLIVGHLGERNKKAKNVISKGSLATPTEIKNGALLAIKQIEQHKRAKIGLSCGTPTGSVMPQLANGWKYKPTYDPGRVYCANGEGGFLAKGSPGSGKTFSYLLPLLLSFILQGNPAAFYDIKYSTHRPEDPCPSALIAGFAKRHGYDVYFLAPGLSSHCLNPLDYIQGPTDSVNSRQLAIAFYQNLNPESLKGGNPFFPKTVTGFLQGLFMLSKLTDYPDLLTVRYLAKLPHLEEIIKSPKIPQAIKIAFDTAVAAMKVGETWGGVQASCSNLLSSLLMPEVLPSICGKSNIPLELDSRQLVIFGMNGRAREVVAPIIASTIHLMTNHNLLKPRKSPYGLWLDELGSIYLPEVDEWPNQHRSAGLCLFVGIQSIEILAKRYGKDGAARIIKGLNTHALFRVNDTEDAKMYCEAIGREDITYKTTGQSKANRSKSTSNSEHRQARLIVEASEVTQFNEGECLLFNPGTKSSLARVVPKRVGEMVKARARVPYRAVIEIPEHDLKAMEVSVNDWDALQARLKRESLKPFTDRDFLLREQHVSALFPSEGVGIPDQQQLHEDASFFAQIEQVVEQQKKSNSSSPPKTIQKVA